MHCFRENQKRATFLHACAYPHVAVFVSLVTTTQLAGCLIAGGDLIARGRNEGVAVMRLAKIKSDHPHVDFDQKFPVTYQFRASPDRRCASR